MEDRVDNYADAFDQGRWADDRSRSPHRSQEDQPRRGGSPGSSGRRAHSGERGNGEVEKREEIRDVNPDTFTQVYVAKLDRRTRESDLEREFSKFGKIRSVTLKLHYAFVVYEDHESAVEAIKEMHNREFVNGETIVVEQSSMYSIY